MLEDLTHLTVVALEVVVLVHGHNPEDLLAALGNDTASDQSSYKLLLIRLELLHSLQGNMCCYSCRLSIKILQ